MYETPGFLTMRRPIFSIVRTEIPVSAATVGHVPFTDSSWAMTYSCSDSFMARKRMPYLGRMQASLGHRELLTLSAVKKKSKTTRESKVAGGISTALRTRLRANVLQVLRHMEPGLTWTEYVTMLTKLTNKHRSMCQRILLSQDKPEIKIEPVGISIDHLEWLSAALGVTPSDLLSAHFKIAKEPRPIVPGDDDRTLHQPPGSRATHGFPDK